MGNQINCRTLLAIQRQTMLYIYIYIRYYNISHLLGKPQGPLLFSSAVGVIAVVGASASKPCFVPGAALLGSLLALFDVGGPVVVAAAAWAPPFVSVAAAVPAPPSSQWKALATTP